MGTNATRFQRTYHSEARVAFIRMLPCIACGATPCANAHTRSGGIARKADYQTVVPLCHTHHAELHQHGAAAFAARYGVSLAHAATETERRWQAHLKTAP